MNRAQNLQFRLYEIITKLQADDPLHAGERQWAADLLTRAACGEDIRPDVGIDVQQGSTKTERPFWTAVHYRALRVEGTGKGDALAEVAPGWGVEQDTVLEYSVDHRTKVDEMIKLCGAAKLLALARWRVKIAEATAPQAKRRRRRPR